MESTALATSVLGKRTLAAIVFTDCVSFSARMAADEEQTLILIKRDLTLMKDYCQRFGGQVLKSTGDGLLMSFGSALEAVQWGIEIQETIAKTAETLPAPEILQHRVGIHLGDVFFCDGDVMGNGVNIAARLEPKAPANGICISQTVYDVVKDRLALEATPLGSLELKNIPEPIPAYALLGTAAPKVTPIVPTPVAQPIQRTTAPETQQDYRDRQILISKVRNFWVKGVLETSLHGKAMLELGLQEHPDAIDHPWGISWRTLNTSEQPFPEQSNAIDLFDQLGAGRTLLILGEPGSGKTTTLLQITRTLLARAEQNATLPVPVVFNLSSWMERQSLADWLVLELDTKYQVPRKIGKSWVTNQQMLLMLDGLDEVSSDRREACVQAINRFHQEHYQTEIVVCSRIRDYEALATHLKFQGAVLIQPLQPEQIEIYLNRAGDDLAGLREVLPTDTQLQSMVKSPLMLSVMTIAYQGLSATDLIRSSLIGDYIKPLFETYVQRMLMRRTDSRYTPEKTRHWLSRLAQQLTQESQTVFLIEQMQPTWLRSGWQSWLYGTGTGLMMSGVVGILMFPLLLSLFTVILNSISNLNNMSKSYTYLGVELPTIITDTTDISHLFSTPRYLALFVLAIILLEGIIWGGFYRVFRQKVIEPILGFYFFLINSIILSTAPFLLTFIVGNPQEFLSRYLLIGLVPTLLGGGFAGLFFWSFLRKPIIPSESFKWSWNRAKEKAIVGALWGLMYGMLTGFGASFLDLMNMNFTFLISFNANLNKNMNMDSIDQFFPLIPILVFFLINGLVLGIIFELLGAVMGGLIGGLTSQSIKTTMHPNQGIWQTFPNMTILAILGAIFGEGLFKLGGLPAGVGAWTGLSLGLLNGGDSLIKHCMLRILLWWNREIPRNYAQFLDYATNCILLQRVGGSYVFIHRMLLEYFADSTITRL